MVNSAMIKMGLRVLPTGGDKNVTTRNTADASSIPVLLSTNVLIATYAIVIAQLSLTSQAINDDKDFIFTRVMIFF